MEMALTKIDGRGRVVIPKRMRDSIGISENSAVFVYSFESLIFLRKVEMEKKQINLKVNPELEKVMKSLEKGERISD